MDALLQWLQPLFADAFTLWGSPTSWLEVVAFVLAVAMVVFNIRVNPIAWPLAIASSLLYFVLFWKSRLYGESSLQIFFAAIAVWGWWQWLHGRQADGKLLQVRRLPSSHRWILLAAFAAAWAAMGSFLQTYTDTDVPWADALPTTGSVIGQWLLGRKHVETWPVWILVNLASVALFAYKGLWLTVVLYAVFIPMSVIGWRAWLQLAPADAAARSS